MWVIEFKDALNLWDWKKKRVKKTKNEKVEKENLHVLVLSVSVIQANPNYQTRSTRRTPLFLTRSKNIENDWLKVSKSLWLVSLSGVVAVEREAIVRWKTRKRRRMNERFHSTEETGSISKDFSTIFNADCGPFNFNSVWTKLFKWKFVQNEVNIKVMNSEVFVCIYEIIYEWLLCLDFVQNPQRKWMWSDSKSWKE